MKRISLWLFVALVTFSLGVSLVAFVAVRHNRTAPHAQKVANCDVPIDTAAVSKQDGSNTILARFREVPLLDLPSCVDESYRVIWIPTFHSPVAVRIWTSAGKRFLVTKELDGKGGYGMGNRGVETKRLMTENEWLTFTRLLDESFFWELPSEDTAFPPNDGAEWVIEGVKSRTYHDVHRRTPSAEFRASCVYLVRLTGLQTEIDRY